MVENLIVWLMSRLFWSLGGGARVFFPCITLCFAISLVTLSAMQTVVHRETMLINWAGLQCQWEVVTQ